MNARLDHRRVLDNLDLGWPAETVTWAQAEYDAELRARQPDDPGVAPQASTTREFMVAVNAELDAPLRGPSWVIPVLFASLGLTLGAFLIAAFAIAWGLL